jgi:hypothetical protein
LLNIQWVIGQIQEEIKRLLEVNEKKAWPTKGKFIAMSANIKRTERSQIIDLMLYLKLLEKQNKQIQKKKERNNKNKGWNSWNGNKQTNKKTRNQQTKKLILWENKQDWQTPGKSDWNEERTSQISKIRNAKGEITSNTLEMQGIIRDYF